MMRKVLLSIPPALSTLLFCAHLLYHGVPLAAAAAPLGALILLAVKVRAPRAFSHFFTCSLPANGREPAGRSSCEGSRRAVRFILRLRSWRA